MNLDPSILQELQNVITKESDKIIQVQMIAEFILNKSSTFNPGDAMSGPQIYEEYLGLFQDKLELPDIPYNTFIIYISKIANSPDSMINCQGKKKGYYIDKLYEKVEDVIRPNDEKVKKEQEQAALAAEEYGYILEKDLYPILRNWLHENNNDRVQEIAGFKGNGKWGNPDLVGFKIENFFTNTEVEVTTIEAKLTLDNWRQWLFEAIAHTIFSNRSYFAFVHSENHINKIEPDLKHYAETFRIGILIIAVDEKDWRAIVEKDNFSFDDDGYRIIEFIPAPFNHPHIKFKKNFLRALGIQEQSQLYNFGKGIENNV